MVISVTGIIKNYLGEKCSVGIYPKVESNFLLL